MWRVLTREEWKYLFTSRATTSGIRYAKATVNNVKGVILLPDDWEASYYTLSNTNTSGSYNSSNTISETEWATLEQHGAVFLPTAGCWNGTSVYDVGGCGYYWSSSYYNGNYAWIVYFDNSSLHTDLNGNRFNGRSVRLVRSLQ